MGVALTEEQWAEVDARILRRGIRPALRAILRLGVGVKDAIDLHNLRYRKLRAERAADFSCTDKEYWQ